jgi:uncharacterized protein YfaQ (DUF2300 family)
MVLLSFPVLLTVGCAPRTFVRSAPGWKVIELRPGLENNYDDAWQTSVDTVARDWDIEIMDKASGYLRTAWTYGISGGSYERYRGRITVKYPNVKAPEKAEVKTEAQWLRDSPLGWITGFDTSFQRDVYAALSGRLGRTVPSE